MTRKAIDNHSQLVQSECMIYCVCNNINTRKVDDAAACGARTSACVMKHHNKKFNCGQCKASLQERLDLLTENANASLLQVAE